MKEDKPNPSQPMKISNTPDLMSKICIETTKSNKNQIKTLSLNFDLIYLLLQIKTIQLIRETNTIKGCL